MLSGAPFTNEAGSPALLLRLHHQTLQGRTHLRKCGFRHFDIVDHGAVDQDVADRHMSPHASDRFYDPVGASMLRKSAGLADCRTQPFARRPVTVKMAWFSHAGAETLGRPNNCATARRNGDAACQASAPYSSHSSSWQRRRSPQATILGASSASAVAEKCICSATVPEFRS